MKWDVFSKSGEKRYEIHKVEYNGEYMGKRTVSVSIKSPLPVEFKIGDHFIYRGEKFTLKYDPSVKKKAGKNKTGDSFTYDNIIFSGFGDELALCDFLDYVLNDNQIHFSSLPSFGFYALTIQDLADRIKANLDRVYTGPNTWTIVVQPQYVEVDSVFITADRLTVWGALALVSSIFKSNFIIRGRTITIGTAGSVIDNVFEYGKNKGLNQITQSVESDQKIITRLRVYGSTRNMPARYYNKISTGVPNNMAVPNLMLPSFPSVLDPYLDSPNISELGVMEGSVFFDGSDESLPEIYPSLEGMTSAEGNLDEVASGSTNIDGTPIMDDGVFEGEDVPPFKLTLKDIGFDINEYLTAENPVISMKNGMCGGREFEILSCEKVDDNYIITCDRVFDEGIGLYFPYRDFKINQGDKFVLLNIEMPDVYVQAASQRLLAAGQEYLSKNDYVRYTYELSVSPVYMARKPELQDSIIEGDYLMFSDEDLNIDGSLIINSLRIKEGDQIIPSYEVVLSEEKRVGTLEKIQNQLNLILSGGQGIGINTQQVESLIRLLGNKIFLSKISPDSAQEVITFLKGIIAAGVSEFADMLVSGKITAENIDVNNHLLTSTLQVVVAATLNDVILKGQLNSEAFNSGFLGNGFRLARINDRWTLELDDIIVRKTMYIYELVVQRIRYQGGQVIHSPAGGKITSVTNGGSYWRVEHDSPESFTTGAQVLCQNFKVGSETQNPDGSTTFQGVSVKRYWRLVTSFGKGWFNLSKTDMEAGSSEPEVGDDIAVLGHRTDPDQQNAIMIVSAGSGSPYIAHYAGINSYSTEGKEVVREGNLSGIVDPDFGQLSGFGLYSNNVYLKGIFRLMNGQTITEFVEDSISLSVSSKVDKDKILASINLSEEGIKIDAEKIEFTGSVSFKSAAKDAVRDDIDEAVEKATFWAIKTSSPVIYKDAPNTETSGAHTTIIVVGELRSGTTSTPGGFITVTPDGGTEAPAATPSPVILSPSDGDGKTSYTIKLYDKADKSVLLDTVTIPVIFKGESGKTLRVERFTTPGWDMYRDGVPYSATLAVKIFYDEEDVTDTINIARFVWIRISENEAGDTVWNEMHTHSGASIDITNADLSGDTSFIVQFWDASKTNLLQTTKF